MDLVTIFMVIFALIYVIRHLSKSLRQGEQQNKNCDHCAALSILEEKKWS